MVVGAIGPWELGDLESQNWLRNAMRSWLARWDVSLGYSDLEPGTGMLFAEVLLEAAIPYRLVLPSSQTDAAMPLGSQPKYDSLLKQAVAAHYLNESAEAGWRQARLHLLEQCDVVITVLTGITEQDEDMLALQVETCHAQRAVVSLDLTGKSSRVICKHDQWYYL